MRRGLARRSQKQFGPEYVVARPGGAVALIYPSNTGPLKSTDLGLLGLRGLRRLRSLRLKDVKQGAWDGLRAERL